MENHNSEVPSQKTRVGCGAKKYYFIITYSVVGIPLMGGAPSC